MTRRIKRWLRPAVLAMVCCTAFAMPGTGTAKDGWTVPLPTLGGTQVWSDVLVRDGWRVQKNLLTGHHRLLDGGDWRRAGVTYEEAVRALDRMAPQSKAKSTDVVVLLHGLGRTRHSMDRMKAAFEARGHRVIAVGYASTRAGVRDHAERLSGIIDGLKGVRRVQFVTHSYGAFVVRQAVADAPWADRIEVGGIVMLAPPSQGAQLADRLTRFGLYRLVGGGGGQDVTSKGAEHVPLPEDVRLCVIAGGRLDGKGYNPMLEGDNDGIVRVEEARLPDVKDFMVVREVHTFIMNHPETIDAAARFLAGGTCRPD